MQVVPDPVSASYSAERAAALAGVPKNTVYYWARTGLVVPSVSRERVKRWSFSDLLLLRLADWLRHERPLDDFQLPPTSMSRIRGEFRKAVHIGEMVLDESVEVYVDARGRLHFGDRDSLWVELGDDVAQSLLNSKVDLLGQSLWREGLKGPDLRTPRPTLRIVPGKLSGEPHVARTRIPTDMIAALSDRGFDSGAIVELYPRLEEPAILDAIDLEKQLAENLHHVPAA
jgi:uncharacterized protein (DUF433 family)